VAVGRHIDILRAGLSRACCLRADLERELAEIADSTSQVPDDEHDAEGSTLGYERARASALLAATRREIDDLTDALARASVRHPESGRSKLSSRRLMVFLGAKGGVGTTTLAANFAVAVAQDSGQKTLLIDLGQPLGDAAINLGVAPEYSSANAFQESGRLDANFLASLLTAHSSGLSVLTAPTDFTPAQPTIEAIDKLLAVARQSFRNVIVDMGARLDLRASSLFEDTAVIYLVAQVGISELRNANRLIKHFFAERGPKLQIVLNRFTPHTLTFDDEHITKALTRPATWRIPDDYATARRTQNTATALVLEDSPIARAIRLMARDACGLPANPAKKKGFSFFS